MLVAHSNKLNRKSKSSQGELPTSELLFPTCSFSKQRDMSAAVGFGFLQPGVRGQRSGWQWKAPSSRLYQGDLRVSPQGTSLNFKQPESLFPQSRACGASAGWWRLPQFTHNNQQKTASSRVLGLRDPSGVTRSTRSLTLSRSTLL